MEAGLPHLEPVNSVKANLTVMTKYCTGRGMNAKSQKWQPEEVRCVRCFLGGFFLKVKGVFSLDPEKTTLVSIFLR